VTKGENLRTIYIFLFLQIAFFFLQVQDAQRAITSFAMIPAAVVQGEVWRMLTYSVFVPPAFGSAAIGLLFTLIILHVIGNSLEEEYGSFHFIALFLISTLVTAVVALVTAPLAIWGAYFVFYTLIIIFGTRHPEQVFYLLFFIPVKAKWIAWFAIALLGLHVMGDMRSGLPVALGTAASWLYFRFGLEGNLRLRAPRGFTPSAPAGGDAGDESRLAQNHREQFQTTKRMALEGTPEERAGHLEELESRIVPGVNICPPVDFKPEAEDAYCIRCEGFSECSARYLRSQMDSETEEEEDSPLRAARRS
jgi:membrane associated rhomboid family serine protease